MSSEKVMEPIHFPFKSIERLLWHFVTASYKQPHNTCEAEGGAKLYSIPTSRCKDSSLAAQNQHPRSAKLLYWQKQLLSSPV